MNEASGPARLRAEELTRHDASVRALLQRLLFDSNEVDDVMQRTYLAALERPPERAGSLLAWLRQVAVNFARTKHREEDRRQRRETLASSREETPATDQIVERIHQQRRVVDAVLGLAEPYRSVTLMRFFDDLPPRKIAARQNVPVTTVKSQLRRAMALLREEFDRQSGGNRRQWALAMLPILNMKRTAAKVSGGGALIGGGLLVGAKLQLVAATAVLGVGAWFGAGWVGEGGESGSEARTAALAEDRRPQSLSEVTPIRVSSEESKAADAEGASAEIEPLTSPPSIPAKQGLVHGRVVDLQGKGLPGLVVVTEEDSPFRTVSDGEGKFSGPWVPGSPSWTLTIDSPDHIPLAQATLNERSRDAELVVVAATKVAVGGKVVDRSGAPLEGASLMSRIGREFYESFPYPLEHGRRESYSTKTNAEGEFLLDLPVVEGAEFSVQLDGFVTFRDAVPHVEDHHRWIEMKPVADSKSVRGIVLHADGSVAAGAQVVLGFKKTVTAEDGSFLLEKSNWLEPTTPLVAAKQGFLPVLIPEFGARLDSEEDELEEPLTLILGAEPSRIRGRLVDADEASLAGWEISLATGTETHELGLPPEFAETLSGSTETLSEEDGGFELTGLLDREYVLWVYDSVRGFGFLTDPVSAGDEDAIIQLSADLVREKISGRVMSRRGEPLEGIRVRLNLVVQQRDWGASWSAGPSTVTDARGFFELVNVPRHGTRLQIDGGDSMPLTLSLESDQSTEDLELTVATKCHFRLVNIPESLFGHAVEFHDAQDQPLDAYEFESAGSSTWRRLSLDSPQTWIFAVSELASELVILEDGQEVDRLPVRLDPGEVVEISLDR